MLLFAVAWQIRPKIIQRPIYSGNNWKEEKLLTDNAINPDTTEAVSFIRCQFPSSRHASICYVSARRLFEMFGVEPKR
ncbi:hypothetical protein COOONC_05583 [Cooperia oncophora]